jgi:hypothetical protein
VAVDPEITRQHLREELGLVKDLAATHKWGVIPDLEDLTILVTMYSHTSDLFIVQIHCDDYKEMPPFYEFMDPDTGQLGTRRAYPKATDSFFHDSGPCVCAPFNRKAYKSVVQTGPHGDWKVGDWQTSTASGIQWANYTKLGDMLSLIYRRVSRSDMYRGRMQ